MTTFTSHGLTFIVYGAEFDAAEREAGAEMIRDALDALPAATVAALHAHHDRANGLIGTAQIDFRLQSGLVEGAEMDCLERIAGRATLALMDEGGWSESANVQHGLCIPMLIITGA